MFIEVTAVRDNEKRLINSDYITEVKQSRIAGCEIVMDRDDGRPLTVIETYGYVRGLLKHYVPIPFAKTRQSATE